MMNLMKILGRKTKRESSGSNFSPHNDPGNNITELQQFHKPSSGLFTSTCSEKQFRGNAKVRLEQTNDIALRNPRAKLQGNPCDENDLAINQHCLQTKNQNSELTRIEIKQDVLTCKNYTDTGTTSHYQILLPTQLLEELLQALFGHNSNQPGITKMIQELRPKYHYLCIAKYNKNGLVTAKRAYEPKESRTIFSRPNCSIVENAI